MCSLYTEHDKGDQDYQRQTVRIRGINGLGPRSQEEAQDLQVPWKDRGRKNGKSKGDRRGEGSVRDRPPGTDMVPDVRCDRNPEENVP